MCKKRAVSAISPPSSGCKASMRAYKYTRRQASGAVERYSIKNRFSMGVVSNIAEPSAKLKKDMAYLAGEN